MNRFIKIFTMFFLISFSSTLYADAPAPVNLSLKGIADWVRFFQFIEYGNTLPDIPSTRGVWFVLWVENEPSLYWSSGSDWIPFVSAGVQAGSVDTVALVDGAVTTSKLANSSVTETKLANGAVTTYKLANDAVNSTKLANGAVTTPKLGTYAVTNEKLGNLAVGTLNIQDGAVTSEKIDTNLSNKTIILNDGTSIEPSLSFSSNHNTGLYYNTSSSTFNISVLNTDKVNVGSNYMNLVNMNQGLNVSSGLNTMRFGSDGLSYNSNALNLLFDNDITASGSIIPYADLSFNLGKQNQRWNNVYMNNTEITGTASISTLLVKGKEVTATPHLKYPRGNLSVDIDCGKYSLRSLGKDLVLFSDSWMMIDYNVTDDGNYFTFKNDNASPAVMLMDSVATMTTATIRLDYENIFSDSSMKYLFGLQNDMGTYTMTLFTNDGKFYLSFMDSVFDLPVDFDGSEYNWTLEHNLYFILDFSETGYVSWKFNLDGEDMYSEKTTVSANSTGNFNISSIHVGDGNGNDGTYSISQDFNAKYRRIQIYPYELSLKEMTSIPILEPIADQQRELAKNMTKCPYYTLGEPSALIGGDFNEGEGFFGEVTGDKFIYGWEVLGQLWGMDMNVIDTKAKFIASFTEIFGSSISYTFTGDSYTALGVSDNLEVEWMKFYDHGKIIFIPKRPLLNNITWNEINNALANCAVGKEIKIDLRRMNPLINSTYSNGNLISVRCRLLTGGNIQPFVYGNVNERGVKDNALCMGSEWNRLMYRICDQIPSDTFAGAMQGYSGGKQLGDNWFNFTGSDLGFGASNDLGRLTFTQEYCYFQNTAYVLARANVYGVGTVSHAAPSGRTSNVGFRPALVLEVLSQ